MAILRWLGRLRKGRYSYGRLHPPLAAASRRGRLTKYFPTWAWICVAVIAGFALMAFGVVYAKTLQLVVTGRGVPDFFMWAALATAALVLALSYGYDGGRWRLWLCIAVTTAYAVLASATIIAVFQR